MDVYPFVEGLLKLSYFCRECEREATRIRVSLFGIELPFLIL